ncbi:MAG: hypothetical protein AAFZ65_12390, partial [Planctomycetota bacterium]
MLAFALPLALSSPLFASTPQQGLVDTSLLVDLNPAPSTEEGSSDPKFLGEHNGEAYFTARPGGSLERLFRTDGTNAGTVDLQANQDPFVRITFGNAAKLPSGQFLAAGTSEDTGVELVTFGPGIDGVQILLDIQPGPETGSFGAGSSEPIELTLWRDEVWFFADDGVSGYELWRSDGTANGTRMAFELGPGPAGVVFSQGEINVAGDRLYFNGASPTQALYVLDDPDGTPLQLVTSPTSPQFQQHASIEFGGGLFFTFHTEAQGNELWFTDGT